ncbi:MAG TPA: tRNA preQ1(34) S-adenosylmethionine ribosyltransferase-isomerase QueA [Candidatus Binatia bacterium]|jgi:S-adenosylmethionine:tRNA ribosyltransferase-isomerase|nr:tRNA preQ1(34) S-adenosylmethionine ribosyltransferase-isomerase QueA [Candidatus Binatia bacterium]
MRIEDLDYALPPELIAQEPAPERTAARLLVVSRDGDGLAHRAVADLPALLRPGDLLVLNDARVIPARLRARRPTGGRLEVLLVEEGPTGEWEALVRGAPRVDELVHFAEGQGRWTANLGDGRWRLRLDVGLPVFDWLARVGEVPLPPYIHRPDGPSSTDRERYQTTFARVPGAVAAPTAGLHFTPALLDTLAAAGVERANLTLHVGPGTFLPIRNGDLAGYGMAAERFDIPDDTVARIAATRAAGGRIVAVGTTTVRALESAAATGSLQAGAGAASLFVRPGHRFAVVDALLTNFHLPRTPLLALVAALTGWERLRAAYDVAVHERYRFYSYGDAMLIA